MDKIINNLNPKYKLDEVKQFFAITAKDNPKDLIEIELGDSKDATKFQPQQKISRWQNECNVSIRLKDFDGFSVETETDKIKLVTPEKEVHLYQVEDGEGASEFEIILNSKPKSNVMEFSVVDKDCDYFFQPKLTEKEIKDGASRPPEVENSYAIYAKTPKTNYTGGKEYKCGKLGHIYRPLIKDSAGTEVWGDLHIENGILSVTIPQEFLDAAQYPVRHAAGLTTGYTSIGSTSIGSSDDSGDNGIFLAGWVIGQLSQGGTMTKIQAALWLASGSGNVKFAVYTNKHPASFDLPDALVANSSSGAVAVTRTTKPTQDSEWTSSTNVSATFAGSNTRYWNVMNNDNASIGVAYDNTQSAMAYAYSAYSSFPPASAPAVTWVGNYNPSIYATYTAAGGASGPANLKSLNSNVKSNIKSYNGNLIANCKSYNTNV